MTYKVVRDSLGNVTACGPEEDFFDPVIPQGGTVELSAVYVHPVAANWHAELMTELRERRDILLNVMDGIQGDALADNDLATAQALKGIKQSFKDIPALPSILDAVSEEAFRQAAYDAYWTVAAGAPLAVKIALAGYLK